MKKIFFIILLSLLSQNVLAYAFSEWVGTRYILYYDYRYGNIYDEGVIVVGGACLTSNLIIPSYVHHGGRSYNVVGIGNSAFYNCTGLDTVNILSSVTSIGTSAFSGCTGLTSVTIPSSVTNIGSFAFNGCTGLTSVTIPSSVVGIDYDAFKDCTGLTTLNFDADSCIYAGGSYATGINHSAFNGCTNLSTVNFGSNVKRIPSYLFVGFSGLTTSIIPYHISCIGFSAFENCTGLTSITIPYSVTSIGGSAFHGCTNLASVNYNAISCVSAGSSSNPVFGGCTNISTFYFGNSVNRIPPYLCHGLSGLTSVTLPNSLAKIGASAFYGCSGLTSISIPNSVDSIDASAFQGCSGLITLIFNAISCSYAGSSSSNRAFSGCTSIASVNFGNSVTTIPPYLCYGFNGLTSLTIPNSVTSIGNSAFSGCTGLTSLTISNSVTSIGNSAFSGCTGLTSITIPPLVTSIGNSAFSGCTGLRLVEFNADSCLFMASSPSGSSSTSWNVFYNTDIRTIGIGSNVKNIPPYAFYGCNHISSITIPDSVRAIGVQAFSGCSSLDTVNLFSIVPPSVGSNTFSSSVDRFNVRCDAYTAYYSSTQWLIYRSRLRSHFYPNIEVTISSSNPTHGTAVKVLLDGRYVSCDSICIISATGNYGYHFDHWSNGRMSNPDTLHLTGDSNVVAYFAPNQYAVYGVPNYPDRGYVLGNDTVDYLDTVVLTAVANHGYMFDHWSDGAYENPHSVVANGNRTITAYFVPAQFTLSVVSSDLNMGTVSGGGNYDYQSNRIIRAIANTGYHFTYWNDGDANNNRTITLTQDTTFTAYFAPNQYTLTLQSADESLGIVTGGGEYAYHDTVTISATAIAPHYHFERWSDNNTENPRQYVITGNTTLTAYFALDVHSVVVQVDDMAHGTVSGGGNYAYGSAATITAETPFSGWVFSHWSDGATYNPYTFAVLQDTVMTAYFVREGSQNGVDGVDTISAKIYVNNGQIVVEDAEGYPVYLYDVVGRLLATKRETAQEVLLDVPTSGAYLVKIGDAPARRIVVRR